MDISNISPTIHKIDLVCTKKNVANNKSICDNNNVIYPKYIATMPFQGTPEIQKNVMKITDKEFQGAKLYDSDKKIIRDKLGWKSLSKEQLDITKSKLSEYVAFQHALALAEMNDNEKVQKYNPNVVTKPLATYNILSTTEAKQKFNESVKKINRDVENPVLKLKLIENKRLNPMILTYEAKEDYLKLNPEILLQRIHPYLGVDKTLEEQHKFIFAKDIYQNVIENPKEIANENILKYSLYYLSKSRKDKSVPLTLKDVLLFQNGSVVKNINIQLDEDGCNSKANFNRSYILHTMEFSGSNKKELLWCKNANLSEKTSGNDVADYGIAKRVMIESKKRKD